MWFWGIMDIQDKSKKSFFSFSKKDRIYLAIIVLLFLFELFTPGFSYFFSRYRHEYVDLGLPSGLKWATSNVGASEPWKYGDFYAWGETKTKKTFDFNSYKWKDWLFENYTKYASGGKSNIMDMPHKVDNKCVLEPGDDAATAKLGKSWRTPTKEEYRELISGCKWGWTNDYKKTGISGVVGVSIANGNKIFFPAAGWKQWDERNLKGEVGCYWTSSLSDDPDDAFFFVFRDNRFSVSREMRFYGQSVRAVLVEK